MVHYFILYTFSSRSIFTMCSPLITSPFFLSSIFISFIANKQSVLENFGVLFLKKNLSYVAMIARRHKLTYFNHPLGLAKPLTF